MRSKVNKIVTSALLVFCMVISVFFATAKAEAVDMVCTEHATYKVKAFSGADVANYRKTKPYQAPELEEGYLFAGWYTNEACTSVVRDGDVINPDGAYYAKGVPEHIADVKAQLSTNLTQTAGKKDQGKIRFVTTVDSLAYQQSGFYISYNGKTIKNTSNTVYEQIVATDIDGNSEPIDPNVFCEMSKFFRACTIKNVTNKSYSVQFDVQAFWVTLDGTEVCGPEVSKQMEDGLLKDVKYVSSITGSDENAGTEEKPYKTLEKAIENVAAYGKIVILDTCTATIADKIYTIPAVGETPESAQTAQTVTIADSNSVTDKHLTITGGTFDLTGASEIHLGDSVKFENIALTFDKNTSLYANGYTLEIAEAIDGATTLSDYSVGNDHSKNLTVYGGSRDANVTGDTNLILRAGTYANIYGGGRISVAGNTGLNSYISGNTNIVIGGTVNKGKTYEKSGEHEHDMDYGLNLFGGGATGRAAIRGNTYITIESANNSFQYIYGGSKATHITGTATINFKDGTAMSLFGGGYRGEAQGDTYVTMTGGTVEQVFGGAQSMNVKANTNVQILGGTVTRRVYGGSYNNYSFSGWADTLSSVTGNSNVLIGPNATISLGGTDATICAVSRYDNFFENEWGVFIFNENATFSDKIGGFTVFGKNSNSHHYMVTTNGNVATGSRGTVSPQGKYIHIEPKAGYSATVYQGTGNTGEELHYTESESIYELPALSASTDSMNIYVEFAIKTDKTNYAAKTGQAYYPTLEEAVDVAHKMYADREKKVADDTIAVTLLSDVEVAATLNITDNANITLTNDTTPKTIYRGSGLSNARWINVAKGATLQIEGLTIDGRTKTEALANTTVASSSGSLYELIKNSGTLTCEHVTFQNVYHYISDANDTQKGCVLYGTEASNMTVTDCAFNDNYTGNSGTALFVDGGSKASITDSKFNGNAAPNGSGGAIYNYAATLETANCEFTNNTSKNNGGAVYLANAASVTVNDTSFSGNTALQGGGVMVDNGAAIFNCCTFKDGKALDTGTYGVALYVRGKSTATINDSTIQDNIGNRNGGAISVYGDSIKTTTVNVNNTDFSGNTTSATWGGAIYVENATANIDNTNFTSNEAKTNGAAIGVGKASSVTVNSGNFTSNHVSGKGGAICASVSSGTAQIEVTGATFDKNYATNDGGAIYAGNNIGLIVDSCTFTGNYSTAATGGAISATGLAPIEEVYSTTLEVKGTTTFTSNKANGTGCYGGAIYVGNAKADITDANFTKNEARHAGAIGSTQQSSITVTKVTEGRGVFRENNALSQGGAIRTYLDTATSTDIFEVQVTGCTFAKNTSAENGGAINAGRGTGLTVKNCNFNENSTKTQGGAIIVTGVSGATHATATITGTSFTSNSATTRGGAIMALYSKLVTVVDSDFDSNQALGTYGGAIGAGGSSTLNVSSKNGSVFKNNITKTYGSALYSDGSSKMTVEGYTFTGNKADSSDTVYFNSTNSNILNACAVKNCNFVSGQTINKTNWNAATYGNNFEWTATE